jgi:hypothetical protein
MNNGLTEALKLAFPGVIHAPRPEVVDQKILDPSLRDPHYHDNVGNWLAGFVEGEGCFFFC